MLLLELLTFFSINLVFEHGLGISSLGLVAENRKQLYGLSGSVLLLCSLGSLSVYGIRQGLKFGAESLAAPLLYLCAVAIWYLLLIGICVLCGGSVLGIQPKYLHRAVCSCAVLGCCYLMPQSLDSVWEALWHGIRCGGGYVLVAWVLSGMGPLLYGKTMPAAVRGWQALLIYLGILSMAFACI